MTSVDGGRRIRFIHDSLRNMVEDSLRELGWFDSTWARDLTISTGEVDWQQPIEPNRVAVSIDNTADDQAELGSDATVDAYVGYVDVFAESDPVGLHLGGDIRDILRGKHPAAGRDSARLEILDWAQATPPVLFTVDIEDVLMEQPRDLDRPYLKHWVSIRFVLVDDYNLTEA